MPTNFPTSLDTFTTKVNSVDTIDASHINDLQDAMEQVETILGASSARRTAWTPTITFETTAPTSITYTTANTGGWYARFGSLIYVVGRVEIATISGGSGSAVVSLPVTAYSGNFTLASLAVSTAANYTTLYPSVLRVNAASTTARLYGYMSTAGFTALTNSNVTGSSTLFFSGFYFHA